MRLDAELAESHIGAGVRELRVAVFCKGMICIAMLSDFENGEMDAESGCDMFLEHENVRATQLCTKEKGDDELQRCMLQASEAYGWNASRNIQIATRKYQKACEV